MGDKNNFARLIQGIWSNFLCTIPCRMRGSMRSASQDCIDVSVGRSDHTRKRMGRTNQSIECKQTTSDGLYYDKPPVRYTPNHYLPSWGITWLRRLGEFAKLGQKITKSWKKFFLIFNSSFGRNTRTSSLLLLKIVVFKKHTVIYLYGSCRNYAGLWNGRGCCDSTPQRNGILLWVAWGCCALYSTIVNHVFATVATVGCVLYILHPTDSIATETKNRRNDGNLKPCKDWRHLIWTKFANKTFAMGWFVLQRKQCTQLESSGKRLTTG